MRVNVGLVGAELTKYNVKDMMMYKLIRLALEPHIAKGRITFVDDLYFVLSNYTSLGDGNYDEEYNTYNQIYRPVVVLNGKRCSNICVTLEELGVNDNDTIEILSGELINITLAFLSGDSIHITLPNISDFNEIFKVLYYQKGLSTSKYDLVLNNTVHEYYDAMLNVYDYGVRDGDIISVVIKN